MRVTFPPAPAPTHLIVAIVQRQDLTPLLAALRAHGCPATILGATGGFRRRPRIALLLAVAAWQVRVVRGQLAAHCHERLEWRVVAPEHLDPHALPDPPVLVAGAIVFVLRIARHERLL
jgi:uncharacterized protein YaaQ